MRHALLLIAFLLPVSLHAQSTEADIKARLVNQPLYLRGQWRDEKLQFTADGQLIGTSQTSSFTVSGIEVHAVKLKSDRLIVTGDRVGLKFVNNLPERMKMREHVRVEVATGPAKDYSAALNAIFADSLLELVPTLPPYWKGYAAQNILHIAPPRVLPQHVVPEVAIRVDGNVTAPVPLSMPNPSFSKAAHDLKFSGKVLVYLWVDKQGNPSHVAILRPAGLGLDEQAISAVQTYRFKPAMRDGEPVTVEINVEVSFDVY